MHTNVFKKNDAPLDFVVGQGPCKHWIHGNQYVTGDWSPMDWTVEWTKNATLAFGCYSSQRFARLSGLTRKVGPLWWSRTLIHVATSHGPMMPAFTSNNFSTDGTKLFRKIPFVCLVSFCSSFVNTFVAFWIVWIVCHLENLFRKIQLASQRTSKYPADAFGLVAMPATCEPLHRRTRGHSFVGRWSLRHSSSCFKSPWRNP